MAGIKAISAFNLTRGTSLYIWLLYIETLDYTAALNDMILVYLVLGGSKATKVVSLLLSNVFYQLKHIPPDNCYKICLKFLVHFYSSLCSNGPVEELYYSNITVVGLIVGSLFVLYNRIGKKESMQPVYKLLE